MMNDTLRIDIPLTIRKRGGRPRILPPKEVEVEMERGQDPHVLRAIGLAWRWRQLIERGEVTTLADLAAKECISDRYVSRIIRLAWLSPLVLERLVMHREPTVLTLKDLCGVAELPWVDQPGRVFDWVLVRDQYDDGGISGGTLERPGLKRLLADIEDGLVDVVVVYKIDRLSRSLMDFSKLVEVFDRNGVTFVSVTQSFNTTTSMGRLTLNILLSFAQFEREVTAERIRDKVRASRMKGMWMGGCPPLGYEVKNRKLVENPADASHVRWVFARFLEIGSGTLLARELAERGVTTARGHRIDKKLIYRMLNNRVYIGEAVHKGASYPGEHAAIVEREVWDKVHAILTESPRKRAARTRADTPALLRGLLYGPDGAAFSPTHSRKGGRLYRYYVSQTVLKHGAGSCPVGRVPAGEIEAAVIDQMRIVFRQPEIVAGTWKAARDKDAGINEAETYAALIRLDPLWNEMFPAEQARIVALLVERVDIGTDGLNVRLRTDGLAALAREMGAEVGAAA